MSYISQNLRQEITWWARGAPDGFGGYTYATPVSRKGRWEARTELFIDANTQEVRSLAVVYLEEDVSEGDYLFLGASSSTDPTAVSNAREIRSFRKVPNISNTLYERKVFL